MCPEQRVEAGRQSCLVVALLFRHRGISSRSTQTLPRQAAGLSVPGFGNGMTPYWGPEIEAGPNPFTPDKVLTMCPEQGVNHVTG